MLKVQEKVVYKAFGFSVISEMPMPELSRMSNNVDSIDIEILIEDLTKQWHELSENKNRILINEHLVMFQIPNVATFSIQNGNKITVSPLRETVEDVIRLYILGTCMGVILMQRKIFPLHGSAVAINGKAYAIVGDSGAGKSTLASAFLSKGYKLLSDDVIAVSLSNDNIPFVTPAYPQQKLWEDSLSSLGMKQSNYRTVYGRETKYCIPVSSQYSNDALPLAGVFELEKSVEQVIEIQRIEKLERFHTFFKHTYRNFLISRLGLSEWHFNHSAKMVNKIDIYHLRRPVSSFSVNELVSTILNTINKGD